MECLFIPCLFRNLWQYKTLHSSRWTGILVPVINLSEYFKKMMNNPRMRVNKEGDIESPSHGNFTSLTAASFTASVSTLSANFSTFLATSVFAFFTCFRASITNVGTKTCDQLRIYTVTSDQLTY